MYFRSKWADVKKHCQKNHGKDIDQLHDDLGMPWGLTRLDNRKAKPTFADVAKAGICLYPKTGEALLVDQVRIIVQANFLEPPGRDTTTTTSSTLHKVTGT